MSEWAKNEVRVACDRETPDRHEKEWDYGCACYESALKAYLSLMEDDHSVMSFGLTKNILIRLLEGKPLTPIDDIPSNWENVTGIDKKGDVTYQCKRMPSLFKTVKLGGAISYSDTNRYYCYESKSPSFTYSGGGASYVLDEFFPIKMPYYPPVGYYKIETNEYLTDRKNGDFDTKEYVSITDPDGNKHGVNRYFASTDNGWAEIDFDEFNKRVEMHNEREKLENDHS